MSINSPRHILLGSVSSQWASLSDPEYDLDVGDLSSLNAEMSDLQSPKAICFNADLPRNQHAPKIRTLVQNAQTQTDEDPRDVFYEQQNASLRVELELCAKDIERLEGSNRSLTTLLKEQEEKQKGWQLTLQDLAVLVDAVTGETGTRDPRRLPNYLKTKLGQLHSQFSRITALHKLQQTGLGSHTTRQRSDSPTSCEIIRKDSNDKVNRSDDSSLDNELPRHPFSNVIRPKTSLTSYRKTLQDLRESTQQTGFSSTSKPTKALHHFSRYRPSLPYSSIRPIISSSPFVAEPPLSDRGSRESMRSLLQRY